MNKLKLFKSWINYKSEIDTLKRSYEIKESEVYWCSVGENIGDEENGKGLKFRRPVLVFKKFNNNIFWAVPLTTKNKENKYYVKVLLKDETVSAMISQLRIIDTKRLDQKIGYVSRSDYLKIKQEIIKIIN
jgi:mRNA interferase MazF